MFLSKNNNKIRLIELLIDKFRQHNCNVIQAETDADYLIATTAINIANKKKSETVIVMGEDVDLLVLLVALTSQKK